jgi:hypothetical protein
VQFTFNNLNPDEKLRSVQLDLMLPMFKGYKTDADAYLEAGKLKKMQALYNSLEKEASENVLLEEYVFEKTGIRLGMRERHQNRLQKIIDRGKLRNAQEYHMIMDQIDILCQLKERNDALINELNALVSAFEKK